MFQSTKQFLRPMALLMGLFSFLHGAPAHAAETDLSDSPLSSVSTADVKPNILFTLDDSGSMNWRFMPDALSTREHRVGFRNSTCNLVYYNPATRYVIPKTSTGLDVNAAAPTTYTAAYENGFGTYGGFETRTSSDSGSTWTAWTAAATCSDDQTGTNRRQCRVVEVASAGPTLDLSSSFRAFVNASIDASSNTRKLDTAQPAYYWNYLGSTNLIPVKGDCELEVAPVFNIKRATYSGGVATFEVDGLETRTSANSGTTWTQWASATTCTADTTNPSLRECRQRAHGLAVGQQVGIGVDPAGYQGIFTVASVPTTRTFTVALATNPGNYRRVSQLQQRTSADTGVTWTAWANVSTCTEVSVGANQTECQVEGATAGYVATCTPSRTGSPGSYAWTGNGSAVDCRVSNGTGAGWNASNFATVTEICTDGSTTTTTCAAAAKTALWRKVVVSATSGPATADLNGNTLVNASDADERTNFANWYSYYGNRLRMMKSASGRAFLGMTDSKRIGFITINPENPVVQSKFITIQDFDVTQKAAWFKTLYSQSINGGTPLREALSRAGRYFAAKTDGINSGMSGDPMQYSCQQNFNILTTDGYWNGAGGVKLDGTTAMDNQDGIIEELDAYRSPGSKYQMSPRPIFDGASTTFNWNTARRYYQLNNTCVQQEKKTSQEQGRLGQWQQQTSQLQKTTGQVQYRTNLQIKTGPLEYQSRIQSKTGQLQYTTNLESRTGALEYQSMIQSKTGQLQYTTNLQRKRGQLQYQSTIQSRTGQLEQRTVISFFPVFTWSGWNPVASCTPAVFNECRIDPGASFVKAHSCTQTFDGTTWSGGASAVECNNTGVLDGTWTNISTCTPSADVSCQINASWVYRTYGGTCTSTVAGATWTGDSLATDCQTIGFNPIWTNRATCDTATPNAQCRVDGSFVKAHSCTTTLSGTNWTGGASAVECNNTGMLDGVFTPIASCTPSSDVFCRINPTPAWSYVTAYAPTCTSTVSGATWTSSGGNATECRAIAFNPAGWTDRATCDTATPNVQCRVNAGFIKTDSCTTTLSGTNWSGGASAVECSTGALDGIWTPIASCTPSTDIFCRVNGTFTDVTQGSPTCTSTVAGATWTSSGGIATDCSTAGGFTAWVNAPTCTESANFQCRINALPVGVQPTVPLDLTSAPCNAQTRSGSPGSYVYTGGAAANYCETVATAPYVDVAYACTPDVNHDAAGRTVECQFRDPTAWTNTPACTMNATTDCRTVDATPWAAASNCVAVTTPDATGQTIQCRPAGGAGFKLEVQGETTSQAYSGPNQTGTPLGTATTNRETTWSDSVPGTCFAAAPAVPGVETVVGVGPPTPPPNCNSGSQIWPCETYTSGVTGGVTANIASATWTPPGADPGTEPAYATFVTAAAHLFLAGHSVTIAGGTNALYRGDWQIVQVPDDSVPANTQFKVLMPGNPGATAHTGGTASLFAGSSNSLADVAQHYYKTDLRTSALGNCTGALGMSVCDDNVPSTGAGIEDDRANWQHMTTFTMGLGLDGTLLYSPSYRTDICVAKSITGASWLANVATITTSTPHGFVANQAVTISGGAVAGYRGQTRIASVPSTTTFTYALTPSPGVGAFGAGTATGCGDFVRLREGTSNWPVPAADGPTALDDLWHAAVNGRGQYFSAGNPDTVVSSLTDALAGINARVAAAAAAATSNLEPVAGDNFAYTAKYKTQAWTGDLEAKEIDLTTGSVLETVIWSAQAKLDEQTKTACDDRTIKLFRAGATNKLVDFKWNTDGCDAGGAPIGSPVTTLDAAEQAHFGAANVALLSQYPSYGTGAGVTVDQRTPAAGANLVNYLRGQRGKEGFSSAPPVTNTDVNKLYRTREHVLGAIINAQPVFVKGPFAEYEELAYTTGFKIPNANRTPIVYASANDGMLHAIYAGSSLVDPDGGKEAWAFMPTMVLPNLYKLASENYASDHSYSVDGTPVVGDVHDPDAVPSPTWKTILVSGMNKGGKGYFALDVTDPATPKALWEFKHDAGNCVTVDEPSKAPATPQYSDCHIGYTFSNPIVSKLRGGADDGRWVVFVTSGYNNINSPAAPGDGQGYLYVLEAMTGKILYKIGTGAGTAADPSGLNHISAWSLDPLKNNTAERIYGGDLLGNVWRFDVNDLLNAAGREAQLVANVQDEDGVGQPITTRPELAEVGGAPFVYVATGRYLGPTDLGTGQKNSVWALRDALGATPLADPRGDLRKLIITTHGSGTSAFRTNGCTTQCDPTYGWYVDLPDPGERVNIDMKLQLGTLVVASNVPETNACNIGGYAWLNYFNNGSGMAVANSEDLAVGRRLVGAGGSESLAVGLNIVRLPSGKTVVIATTSAAQQLTVEAPFDVRPPQGKRVSWREIVQ